MMKYLETNDSCIYVAKSGNVKVPDNCNGWVLVNMGDTTIRVNQVTVLPRLAANLTGGQYGLALNIGEVYLRPELNVIFDPPLVNPYAMIIFKVYADK